MVSDFEIIVEACHMLYPQRDERHRRGRKKLPRHILIAIVYLAHREGWTPRQAERWCLENISLLRQVGWPKSNPPRKSTIHNLLNELKVSDLHRITIKVKELKGETKLPPYINFKVAQPQE